VLIVGEYANEIEHVYPRSTKLPTYVVPACKECNLLASDALFSTFEEKSIYIRNKLRKRYKKILSTPEWTSDEIKELRLCYENASPGL
jgi:hypothetical protein